MLANAWVIPLLPLAAFVLLLAGGRRWKEGVAAWVGSIAVLAACVWSLGVLAVVPGGTGRKMEIPWLSLGDTVITMGMEVNRLNALMLLIVSLVSFLVHVYSRGYMRGDERFSVFYAYLALFTFSMLGLVISPNLLQFYIFWELVGVCSFLLIGYWYYKPEAKAAAKKAFILTRIGDVGLFIAVILAFWHTGTLEISGVIQAVQDGKVEAGIVTLIALLIFAGAVGKSGQFPLHTWLPDAMEGPTPVSALIHAATMVAAGVYLVARTFPLFEASPVAMDTVAYVGAFTALFAASIGLVQNDIKRVLAYSTVSQLGYMMLALGSAGYTAGVFHLMTHAFFKALLFLGAGAVIVALHHEQDIRRMGGLWNRHKGAGVLFLIGCLAISGIPPFSGFFSKEEVLLSAWQDGRWGVFAVGVLASFFTAFYMFRLFFLVFAGEYRGKGQPGPVSSGMMWPMGVLAALALLAGFAEFPGGWLSHWLTEETGIPAGHGSAPVWLPLLTVSIAAAGIALAWGMYVKQSVSPEQWRARAPWGYRVLLHKYYVDEGYAAVIALPYKGLSIFLRGFDRYVVEGLVRLATAAVQTAARVSTRLQNGQVQTYALISVIGLVLLMIGLAAGRLF
ncbi:NADH-quinone oxidoreductase subunit L [Marinithermofilum abyssi]|uniref:NADH-quinone oxidoreductase subunit L n=1 Tax=Marinithermofilum abyssi TaxID=1571185 RepID=A0A8J2VE35_9BACL|nr:NADH-quinone oxidoreductase subunit L [Marinithermofilum abyssi]GGE05153.1 NADH-quinone oxidoreductase subunit L [Marinithermofilum abyssi]